MKCLVFLSYLRGSYAAKSGLGKSRILPSAEVNFSRIGRNDFEAGEVGIPAGQLIRRVGAPKQAFARGKKQYSGRENERHPHRTLGEKIPHEFTCPAAARRDPMGLKIAGNEPWIWFKISRPVNSAGN